VAATGQNQVMRNLMRKPVSWVVLGVLTVGVVVGMWLFQPWKLFVDQTVDEALPDVTVSTEPATSGSPSPASEVLADGTFITHEHDTTGTVQVVRLPDGRRVLAVKDLDTSNGPDLRVWLTDREVIAGRAGWHVFDDGRYLELGRLKGNQGSQVYTIPKSADLSDYRSVTIWCRRFAVSFGAAELAGR
jgi:hypothetical protein